MDGWIKAQKTRYGQFDHVSLVLLSKESTAPLNVENINITKGPLF